ncbi:MAG: hypothetical protein JKY66_04825 [Spongiibacteraceae bacterium]|nr:hypothetical protein [Spongiibacteraceae bacterium]
MKPTILKKNPLSKLMALATLAVILFSNSVSASEKLDLKISTLKDIEFSKNLKIRGIKLVQGVYMGQAKVGGKYGFGVVVDRKSYSWGINNRGVSISKRF